MRSVGLFKLAQALNHVAQNRGHGTVVRRILSIMSYLLTQDLHGLLPGPVLLYKLLKGGHLHGVPLFKSPGVRKLLV